MTKELIKPDFDRCQAEVLDGSFMTLGPRSFVRCKNKPVYIATENEPQEDGLIGSMSLCEECSNILIGEYGKDFAVFKKVKMTKEELLIKLKEWLTVHGIKQFKEYKEGHGTVSPVFSVSYSGGNVPYSVHFREGIQVRNFLRTQEYCKDWDCHKLDNEWANLIEECIGE